MSISKVSVEIGCLKRVDTININPFRSWRIDMAGISASHRRFKMPFFNRTTSTDKLRQSHGALEVLDLDFDKLFISMQISHQIIMRIALLLIILFLWMSAKINILYYIQSNQPFFSLRLVLLESSFVFVLYLPYFQFNQWLII